MQVNDPGRELGELCSSLVRKLRFLERSELACCGIPMSQAMVLQTLAGTPGGLRMGAVATALGVTQSTATRLVEPLVEQGRVERVRAPDDGRSVLVRLTGEGRAAAAGLERQSRRWSAELLDRIPPARRPQVIEALRAVTDAVSECCADGCGPLPPNDDGERQ